MACLQRCSIIDKVKLREIDVSEAKWVRQHENENARLTTLFAEAMLNMGALRELLSKTLGRP
jgi:hypothetical protein